MSNKLKFLLGSLMAVTTGVATHSAMAANVVTTDQVVKGSICTGVDCANSPSFGFDTIRLKENNLRIKFEDSSSSGSFPSNDWMLTANDSGNGGLNKFSIEDVTGGKVPFTILAGAPSNSFYMKADGNIGVGTSAPAVEVHIADGDSPTLRLEQNGSSGFTAQTWDIAGNETNFFVRDVTNSSKLPFRIKTGADKNSIFIDGDGSIGLRTETPDGMFDIADSSNGNNHAFLVDDTGRVGINIDNGQSMGGMFELQSTGGVKEFTIAADGATTVNGLVTATEGMTVTGTTTINSNVTVNSDGRMGFNTTDLSDVSTLQPIIKLSNEANTHNSIQMDVDDSGLTSNMVFTDQGTHKWTFSSRNDWNSGSGPGDYMYFFASDFIPAMALFQDKTVGFGGIHYPESGKSISHANGAYLSTAGVWTNASSRELKDNIEQLSAQQAMEALNSLEPVTYNYKVAPDESYTGFIAEDVPDLVATKDRKSLASMDVVAVLTKVVKEQQATIETMSKRLAQIEESK